MGNMTTNFSLEEFACPCCGKAQVDGRLPIALQNLRDLCGQPITIHSGYRCPKHNAEVGGKPGSQHTQGKAADIVIARFAVWEMYEAALRIPVFRDGGIGLYDGGFVHVDIRQGRARWARIGGEYVSIGHALVGNGG